MNHAPGFLALVDEAKKQIKEITVQELKTKQAQGEPLRVIDVREDDEWRTGHAKGAEHLGRGIVERDIEGQIPDKSTVLVLYCGGGFRSALAAASLKKMGYHQVLSLAGGYRAWQESGGAIES